MKKLLAVLALSSSFCYAGLLDSTSSMSDFGGANSCMSACDPGAVMLVLDVKNDNAKSMSKTACQTACLDKCFSSQINKKEKSEVAALSCKDSLKKTFKLD